MYDTGLALHGARVASKKFWKSSLRQHVEYVRGVPAVDASVGRHKVANDYDARKWYSLVLCARSLERNAGICQVVDGLRQMVFGMQ